MAERLKRKDLVHMAKHIHPGNPARFMCPECDGGPTGEMSGQLYRRVEDNSVWFKCWRASCPRPNFSVTDEPAEGQAPPPPDRSYHGRSEVLPQEVLEWACRQFPAIFVETAMTHIRWNPENESLIFPIRNVLGTIDGYVERFASTMWSGPVAHPTGTKVRTFPSDPEKRDLIGWWRGHGLEINGHRAILVEDALSAMVLSQYTTHHAVALLGTGINQGRIRQLQRAGVGHIVFALDADATGQAFAHARKWGLGFSSCRVLVLDRDIKDMNETDLKDLL